MGVHHSGRTLAAWCFCRCELRCCSAQCVSLRSLNLECW